MLAIYSSDLDCSGVFATDPTRHDAEGGFPLINARFPKQVDQRSMRHMTHSCVTSNPKGAKIAAMRHCFGPKQRSNPRAEVAQGLHFSGLRKFIRMACRKIGNDRKYAPGMECSTGGECATWRMHASLSGPKRRWNRPNATLFWPKTTVESCDVEKARQRRRLGVAHQCTEVAHGCALGGLPEIRSDG